MVAPRRFDLGRSLALSRGGDNRQRSERQGILHCENLRASRPFVEKTSGG